MSRELGVLSVNTHAYEDFLQTADAAIRAAEHARAADQPEKADPSEALQAGDAAYRLGSAAWRSVSAMLRCWPMRWDSPGAAALMPACRRLRCVRT